MRGVVIVFVTFFCIVFGKRYPRGFNDSAGMIHRDYANRTVPKNDLNFIKDKDINLTKYYDNSTRVVIIDNRLKFNGTKNAFKNYPKVNQFRLRRTMIRDNSLKKIKTGNKKSTDNKKPSARVTLNHQDHSKKNRTQDQKINSTKDVNKKSTNSKVQQEKLKDPMSKNKNIKEVIRHHHHHRHVGGNHRNHSKRTTVVERIFKLANKRSMNMGTQKDSQRRKTFLNEKPKYKRDDQKDLKVQKKYSEWLILPDRSINSFDDFQNDSVADEYRRKLIILPYRQSGVPINKNKLLSNGQSNGIKSGNCKRQNFVNNQNSNFNDQIMRKSPNPNVLNVVKQNPGNFRFRIVGMQRGEGFQKLDPRRPNVKNIQNVNSDTQYDTDFQNRNFYTIDANGLPVANPTAQSLTNYPNLSSSQYRNLEERNTMNYGNSNFDKQSLINFAESEIPPTRVYRENFESNVRARNSVDSKSILQNHTKFQTISFKPGQSSKYPGLQEIYHKNLGSKLSSSPKKERRGILTDDPYNFHREHFGNLPTGEIFHQRRVVVENSIVPTKLYAKDENLENFYKGVRFFLDRRIKREDYYRLPLEESKKDSTTRSDKYSKSQSKIVNDKEEVVKTTNFDKSKPPKSKISNRDYSLAKNSIRNRDVDEFSLNLKDNGHDYVFEEDYVSKAEEQEDYSDSTSHEDHTSSLRIKDIPKTRDMIIFKREINKSEATPENPSNLNLNVPEMMQKNFEETRSKRKRLTSKINRKVTRKDEKDQRKVLKIGFKKKESKKDHPKAKENDSPKTEPDEITKIDSKTKTNIPEQDHQVPDLKYDGIKEDYVILTDSMMADALNEDLLNKNILLATKIKENDLTNDFITSNNTQLTSMRPIIIENKEWNEDDLKRKLTARDKMADDDSDLYGLIESEISTDSNLKDYKPKESNRESESSAPIQFESFHDRKTWDHVGDLEGSIVTNNESVSMIPPNPKESQQILDTDQMTPYKRNNLIYKPYAMGIGSRSFINNVNNKQFTTESNSRTLINTTNIKWNAQDHLDPNDVNFEVHGKQLCTKNILKGIDFCSEEDSQEDKGDAKKKWPISPGPIVCDADYDVSTTFATKPTEYPFVVSIQYQNLLTNELSHACNGIIVGPRFIVSAAHCLNNRDNFELVVQRTHDLCDEEVKPVPVVLVIEHENYNRHTRMNDLALLRLKYEVDTDKVSMPENGTISDNFYSVGWGELMWNRFEKNVTKIQQKIPVSRYHDKMKEDPGTIYVTTAGLDITGAFRGDYGGILMNENDEFIGVQSKHYQDEDCEVFIRIRTYLPWIESMMKYSKRLLEHPYKFQTKKPKRDVDD